MSLIYQKRFTEISYFSAKYFMVYFQTKINSKIGTSEWLQVHQMDHNNEINNIIIIIID